jgi:hypothetical protein
MGRCTAMTVDDRYSEEMLKVFCESPHELPAASIALRHEPSGREWRLRLNSAFTYSPGPHETWLSPLHRGQSFFRLTNSVEVRAGSQWLVPKSYLSSAHVEVTPEIVIGHVLAGSVALASWACAALEGRIRILRKRSGQRMKSEMAVFHARNVFRAAVV